MKKILLIILSGTFGKKNMQGFYEALFRISLKGMNYGNGGNFKDSGEMNVLNYVKENLSNENPIILFDVGANVGNYSKALADFFGVNSVIHAFEPSKKTFDRFQANTHPFKNIIPNNIGLGDCENKLVLFTNSDASGLASVYQRNLGQLGIVMDKNEEISISTIDNYCKEKNISRIHFLKLDIEGHELSALKGAEQMLKDGKIDFIQFEFGGTNIDSKTFFRDFFYLLKSNYVIYRVLKDGLREISKYSITQEVFSSINYLVKRRDINKDSTN